MKTLAVLMTALTLLTTSCKKDDDVAPDKTKILTSGSWQLSAMTVDPAIDWFGTPVTNVYSQLPACVKDDLAIFKTNGNVNYDEGASKCDPNDPQTSVDEMAVLLRAVKTRRESAAEYEKGGRAELAANELAEVEVLSAYLPKPMDDDQARAALRALSAELGLTEKKQMSQLMKAALERHRGTLDGRQASRLLGEILS